MTSNQWPAAPPDDREKRPWVYLRLIHEGLQINSHELRAVIERPATDATTNKVVFAPGLEQERFFGEVYTRLHNYVSVVATLVAVSRNYVRAYIGTAFATEQKERVKAIGENQAAQLLQGLRNYVVHYNVPYMEMTLIEEMSPRRTRSILHISSKSLLDCKGWKPAADRYLHDVDMINLGHIVDEYTALIEDYYSWFWVEVEKLSKMQR